MITFRVSGPAVPCPRPRVIAGGRGLGANRSGSVSAYYDSRYTRWRDDAGWMARAAMGDWRLTTEPVSVSIEFHGLSVKADIDNACKSVLDAIQGILIVNDNQVMELHAKRRKAPKVAACTVVTIERISSADGALSASSVASHGAVKGE